MVASIQWGSICFHFRASLHFQLPVTANTRFSRALQLIGVLPAFDAHSSFALALLATLGRGTGQSALTVSPESRVRRGNGTPQHSPKPARRGVLRGSQGERGGALPGFVREEFKAYLRCGRLEHGFIRAKCTGCRYQHLVAFSAIAPAVLSGSVPDSPLPRPSMGSYLPHPCGRAVNAAVGARRAHRGAWPRPVRTGSIMCCRAPRIASGYCRSRGRCAWAVRGPAPMAYQGAGCGHTGTVGCAAQARGGASLRGRAQGW